jgi:hypothetical protein
VEFDHPNGWVSYFGSGRVREVVALFEAAGATMKEEDIARSCYHVPKSL